jgi:hypothetical protein
VRETGCETVTLESNGKIRQFKPSAKGKWDVLVSSTMQNSNYIEIDVGHLQAHCDEGNRKETAARMFHDSG